MGFPPRRLSSVALVICASVVSLTHRARKCLIVVATRRFTPYAQDFLSPVPVSGQHVLLVGAVEASRDEQQRGQQRRWRQTSSCGRYRLLCDVFKVLYGRSMRFHLAEMCAFVIRYIQEAVFLFYLVVGLGLAFSVKKFNTYFRRAVGAVPLSAVLRVRGGTFSACLFSNAMPHTFLAQEIC